MTPTASWAYHEELTRLHEEVLATKADMEAFGYDLNRLPSLWRIITTPCVHGFLFTQVYRCL